MKIIQLLFLLMGVLFSNPYRAQPATIEQIPSLLKTAALDSVQKIERLAALKFHRIINHYRNKNRLDTIAWDNALWLTCRNHDVWMSANSILTHDESKGTKYFTGIQPSDRYKYTTSNKGTCSWSGENALYNFDKHGKNINEIATNIASSCFEQWQHSPGHNSNMLGKNHKVHGAAFYLSRDGRVYGTDLFASNIDYIINEIPIQAPQEVSIEINEPVKTINATLKRVRLDINKIKTDLLNKLYVCDSVKENTFVKRSKAMEKASNQHSEYMCYVKQLTHNELKSKNKFYGATQEQRMMKATHGFYFFKKHRVKLSENIAVLDVDATNLNLDKLATDITSQLNLNENDKLRITGVGYGLSLKRNKNNLKVYVTRMVTNKKV